MKNFDSNSPTLVLQFDNVDAVNHFKSWLCESGEQHYWDWMIEAEEDWEGNISGINFDYSTGSTIKVTCGRLNKWL